MWELVSDEGHVSSRIVNRIEQLLAGGDLRPGDRLPSEREMADMLGTSRPSVREAVRSMQARGLVEVRRGQGVYVTDPHSAAARPAEPDRDTYDMDELFAMREVLEPPAAEWAAERISAVQLADLRGILDELDATNSDLADQAQRLATADAAFHLAVADIAGNQFLIRASRVLHHTLIAAMRTTVSISGRRGTSRQEHEALYAALRDHDPNAANRAAVAHIRSARSAARGHRAVGSIGS